MCLMSSGLCLVHKPRVLVPKLSRSVFNVFWCKCDINWVKINNSGGDSCTSRSASRYYNPWQFIIRNTSALHWTVISICFRHTPEKTRFFVFCFFLIQDVWNCHVSVSAVPEAYSQMCIVNSVFFKVFFYYIGGSAKRPHGVIWKVLFFL